MRPGKPDTVIAAFRVALARAIPEPRNVAPREGDLRVPRKFLCWERRAARVTHDFRRDKMAYARWISLSNRDNNVFGRFVSAYRRLAPPNVAAKPVEKDARSELTRDRKAIQENLGSMLDRDHQETSTLAANA